MIHTGESRRLLDSAVDASKEGRRDALFNRLEMTVRCKGLRIHHLLVKLTIIRAVPSLIHHASVVSNSLSTGSKGSDGRIAEVIL